MNASVDRFDVLPNLRSPSCLNQLLRGDPPQSALQGSVSDDNLRYGPLAEHHAGD